MRRRQRIRRSGILAVDKPAGPTSFDVVRRVRTVLGAARVGHAGTLDPDATGVLPLLLGEATKLMPYLVDDDKEYVVTVRFGVTTDTHDVGGRVLRERPVDHVDRDAVVAATRAFVGRIEQVPPMYSALHHDGRRLYELAREGVEVPRPPREVVVREIEVERVEGARACLRVVCGKGTYVRVLAADVGERLGCGAAVERLVRTRVGPFTLGDAVAWAEVERGDPEALWSRVLGPEAALAAWRAVHLDTGAALAFTRGQTVRSAEAGHEARLIRVHDATGRFIGVGRAVPSDGAVKPERILHADDPGTAVLQG